jgi:hypothetical protein
MLKGPKIKKPRDVMGTLGAITGYLFAVLVLLGVLVAITWMIQVLAGLWS